MNLSTLCTLVLIQIVLRNLKVAPMVGTYPSIIQTRATLDGLVSREDATCTCDVAKHDASLVCHGDTVPAQIGYTA